jgi:hypothetical protein
MALKIAKVDTWAAAIEDKAGALSAKLNALAAAGVNLEFIVARRAPDSPGTGVVFVTPIKGAKGTRAAGELGFKKTESLHTIRIEGSDKKGQGGKMTAALAEQGLNLRGVAGAAIGNKFVTYIAVDSPEGAAQTMSLLRRLK